MNNSKSPRFSIVTPVFRTRPDLLELTIDSVVEQTFSDWEWILVDDASNDPALTSVLSTAKNSDSRITVIEREENGHISRASNDGLARARGEWIVLLDHDDLLDPFALEKIDEVIAENPSAGYIYTDEDKVSENGEFSGAFQKPEWSPERLRHQMYTGHISALKHDLVKMVGGFREGFEGSQDHDLVLRVTERCEEIVHIPEILYHWRMVPGSTAGDPNAKGYATKAGIRAVQEHLTRIGRDRDTVSESRAAHAYMTTRHFNPDTRVSVVIPTRGSAALVWGEQRVLVTRTVDSLLQNTDHENLEIVVIYDKDTRQDVLDELRLMCGHKLVLKKYTKPFNFADKCNLGFLASTGDIIVFLNDDMHIRSPRFIESLCAPLEEPDVGATGAFLTYSDGRIQHAGIITKGPNFSHAYLGYPEDSSGYFEELNLDHEVTGVTGACVATRRDTFNKIGGFTMALPSNFNDVDFSLKIQSLGLRIIWLESVRATHFESMTRNALVHDWEVTTVLNRWGRPERDPYMPYEAERIWAPSQIES